MLNLIGQTSRPDMTHWTPGAVLELILDIAKWLLASGGAIIGLYALYRTAKNKADLDRNHVEGQEADKVLAKTNPVSNANPSQEDLRKLDAIATGDGSTPVPDPTAKSKQA